MLVLDKAGVVMVAFVDLYCCKQRSRVCPPQQIGICLRHKGLLPSLQRIRAKLLTSTSVLDTDAKVALIPELQLHFKSKLDDSILTVFENQSKSIIFTTLGYLQAKYETFFDHCQPLLRKSLKFHAAILMNI